MEHEQTIAKGRNRLSEIELQKEMNLERAELANEEMDDEARKLKANEAALVKAMADIDNKLDLMVKDTKGDG
jgi:hypothetical protein